METILEIGKFAALGIALCISIIGITTDFRQEVTDGRKKLTKFGYAAILLSTISVGLAAYLSITEKQIARMNALEQERKDKQRELAQRLQNSSLYSLSLSWRFDNVPSVVFDEFRRQSEINPHDGLEDLTIRFDDEAKNRFEELSFAEAVFYPFLSEASGQSEGANIAIVNFGEDRRYSVAFGLMHEDGGTFEAISPWEGVFHFKDWPNIFDELGWPYPDASASFGDNSITLDIVFSPDKFRNGLIPASNLVEPSAFLPNEVEVVLYSASLSDLPFNKTESLVHDKLTVLGGCYDMGSSALRINNKSSLFISVNGSLGIFAYDLTYSPQSVECICGGIGDPYMEVTPPRWFGRLREFG